MRPAVQGATPELNPEGSPRRDAEAGGGWTSLQQGSWGPGHSGWQGRQAQWPRAPGARPVPLWRRGKTWLGKAVGSPKGCPVSAPVSAGVRLAPNPAAVVQGLRSVSHLGHWSRQARGNDTALTWDTGVISQTLT